MDKNKVNIYHSNIYRALCRFHPDSLEVQLSWFGFGSPILHGEIMEEEAFLLNLLLFTAIPIKQNQIELDFPDKYSWSMKYWFSHKEVLDQK